MAIGGLAVVISLAIYGRKEQERPQIPQDTKTYQQSGEMIVPYNGNGVALGDIDGDGDLDIVASGDGGWNKGGIYLHEKNSK